MHEHAHEFSWSSKSNTILPLQVRANQLALANSHANIAPLTATPPSRYLETDLLEERYGGQVALIDFRCKRESGMKELARQGGGQHDVRYGGYGVGQSRKENTVGYSCRSESRSEMKRFRPRSLSSKEESLRGEGGRRDGERRRARERARAAERLLSTCEFAGAQSAISVMHHQPYCLFPARAPYHTRRPRVAHKASPECRRSRGERWPSISRLVLTGVTLLVY